MRKIETTGLDRKYQPPPLKKLIAMSFGLMVTNLLYMVQARIQIYGQKVLGLDPFFIVLYLAIFTIVDIINDPIIARKSDKSTRFTRKFGKRFVFIMIGHAGMLIFIILLFIPWELNPNPPYGLADPNMTMIVLIWIALMVSLFECAYTAQEMNRNALEQDLFRDQETRRRFSVVLALIVSFLGMILGLLIIPFLLSTFNAFDAEGKVDNPNAFFMMTIGIVLVYLIFLPVVMYGIWESKEMREFRADLDEKIERPPFLLVIKHALSDRNWIAYMITSIQWAIFARIAIVGLDYYIIDGLGLNIGMAMIPMIFYTLGLTIFRIFGYFSMKKLGTKKTYMIGMVIACAGLTIAGFSNNLYILSAAFFIAAAGLGLQNASRTVFKAQALDESILKHGTREEAQYISIDGIFKSTSTVIQALIFAIITVIFGYNATIGTSNTELAKFGLLFNISFVPMFIILISGIVFWKLFSITPEKAKLTKEKLLELGR